MSHVAIPHTGRTAMMIYITMKVITTHGMDQITGSEVIIITTRDTTTLTTVTYMIFAHALWDIWQTLLGWNACKVSSLLEKTTFYSQVLNFRCI